MSPSRVSACLLAALVSACASTPSHPVTFGTPEPFGPGLVRASRTTARVTLTDSAHVILLRVYPGAGVDTYFPDSARSGLLHAGTYTLRAPVRSRRIFAQPRVAEPGPGVASELACRQQARAIYGRQRSLPGWNPAAAERMVDYVCSRQRTPRPVGAVSEVDQEGYLFLIVSDVPTPGGPLRDALRWMIIEPDSIGAALPALAEALVGGRTPRWAAYSLAPRP